MHMLLPTTFIISSLLVSTQALADDASRSFEQSLALENVHTVEVDVHVGEIQILPSDSNTLSYELTVTERDDWFASALADASMEVTNEGGVLTISLAQDAYQEEWIVYLPASVSLNLNVGVGEAELSSLQQDTDVNIGVGGLDVTLPIAAFAKVEGITGVGDVSIKAQGENIREESHLVGKESRWFKADGKGYAFSANVGVGSADITLESNSI
ncbi:hypothetical protein ACFSJ3_08460 [Corallincola platygyrae]|uniref:Adhesin domain-containing protein n=1 Tax=Corallincola platygyrae TaxID=1193278 RepID=A0ABW4XNV4_9GAMM